MACLEALCREGVHLRIKKNQPGPLWPFKTEWPSVCFWASVNCCENECAYNTVPVEGALVLIGMPGDIDPVTVRVGHGLNEADKLL